MSTGKSSTDYFKLDSTKPTTYNVFLICNGICDRKTSDILQICYLNELIKIFDNCDMNSLGYSVNDLLSW